MCYLHKTRHCCHRDLKSPNILLSGKAGGVLHAKIADFGMSKIVVSDVQTKAYAESSHQTFKGRKSRYGGKTFEAQDSSVTLKTPDMMQGGFWTSEVGTLEWLAPELMKACKDRVKMKSHYTDTVDQYAFGCIMYECLELRPPWSHDNKYTWSENIYDALMAGLRPPTTKFSTRGYNELMKLCWAQLPSRRPGFDVIFEKLQRIRHRTQGRAPKHSLSGAIRSVVRGVQSIDDVTCAGDVTDTRNPII